MPMKPLPIKTLPGSLTTIAELLGAMNTLFMNTISMKPLSNNTNNIY